MRFAAARLATTPPWRSRVTCRAAASMSSLPPPPVAATVAAVAVGDELLEGAVTDANTPFLASMLTARGADLVEAAFVRDDAAVIAATVARLSKVADAVVVAGGVGPTHDDVTYAALAGPGGLTRHAGTVAAMEVHYGARGVPLTPARLTMADLPPGATVLTTPGTWVPLVRVAPNTLILPGVPSLFRKMLEAHADSLFGGPPTLTASLLTPIGEGDVAVPLAAVAARVGPTVKLGSYILAPEDGAKARGFNVRLRLRSRCATALAAAVAEVEGAVPGAVREEEGE